MFFWAEMTRLIFRGVVVVGLDDLGIFPYLRLPPMQQVEVPKKMGFPGEFLTWMSRWELVKC